MNFKKLSIVIPAYNEGATIHLILNRIAAVKLLNDIEKEVIIVNDCSKDNTEEAIQAYISAHPEQNIRYIKHEVNKGKGAALAYRYRSCNRRIHHHPGCRPGVRSGRIQCSDPSYHAGTLRTWYSAAASSMATPIVSFSSGTLLVTSSSPCSAICSLT